MVIFDQNGNRLYASDDDVAKSIDANDLEIINGTEEDQVFYEVFAALSMPATAPCMK